MKAPCKACGKDKTLHFSADGTVISCRQGCEKYADFQAERQAAYQERLLEQAAINGQAVFDRTAKYRAYDMPHGWRK